MMNGGTHPSFIIHQSSFRVRSVMSFGLPPRKDQPQLTYGGYLKVSDLISLQQLHSDPPQHDEMLFIVIHQVYELWFKELLHELDSIIERLDRDQPLAAHKLVRRCIEIERVLVSQIEVLETMMPVDFLAFRELEYVSGLKDARFLKNYEAGSNERTLLEARLARPTLVDAFYAMLGRRGFNLPMSSPDNREASDSALKQRLGELKRIYQHAEKHYDLFLLTESLIEYDEMFSMWRLRHVMMVERMIGSKSGTGGSEGAAYLKKTVERKFFPDLWELRTELSKRNE